MRSIQTQHLTLDRQLPHVTTAGFMVALTVAIWIARRKVQGTTTLVPKAGTLLVSGFVGQGRSTFRSNS